MEKKEFDKKLQIAILLGKLTGCLEYANITKYDDIKEQCIQEAYKYALDLKNLIIE
jgi:hypothetical protein